MKLRNSTHSIDAPLRPLARLGVALFALSVCGCQFFFPTPIESHVDRDDSAKIVRSIGAPFRAGESMKVEVFLDDVLAGRGELHAGSPCKLGGQTLIPVATSAESTGLARLIQSAKADTAGLIDLETSFPVEARSDSTIGKDRGLAEVMFSKSIFDFRHTRFRDEGNKINVDEIRLPIEQTPHDGHSALGYLRNWRPAPGTHGFLYAVYGRHPWKADLVFAGPELLRTAHGDAKVVRIDGVAEKLIGRSLVVAEGVPKRPFTMWFSDDERRAPLRILIETNLAKITIELVAYKRTDPPKHSMPPCAPLFDEKALRAAVIERLSDDERKERERAAQKLVTPGGAGSGQPPDDGAAKTEDEQKDEKDPLERLLKSSSPR